jgi:hypothetical protein
MHDHPPKDLAGIAATLVFVTALVVRLAILIPLACSSRLMVAGVHGSYLRAAYSRPRPRASVLSATCRRHRLRRA